MIALIISDVLGDPLEVIASGPTVQSRATPDEALETLKRFAHREEVPAAVWQALENPPPVAAPAVCRVTNLIIGNNATAVDAAGMAAERLGYSHAMVTGRTSEGAAEDVGRHLADMALHMRQVAGPDCLISGGEPTVRLVAAERRGRGGRNQQLVLAALQRLNETQGTSAAAEGIVLLSAGTDGEDGPTDAAGAVLDERSSQDAQARGLDIKAYLERNDAYAFWEAVGGLIKTGPTHTNVCDLRVALVDREELGTRDSNAEG